MHVCSLDSKERLCAVSLDGAATKLNGFCMKQRCKRYLLGCAIGLHYETSFQQCGMMSAFITHSRRRIKYIMTM